MLNRMRESIAWLSAPERRYLLPVAVLLVALLVELQFAVRYVYVAPVWELGLFDEMLINAMQATPPTSLLALAWHYTINGHWLFVPFWLFYADFAWDDAIGRIPMLASWLSLLAVAVMMGRAVSASRQARLLAILLIAVAVFSPAAMESMISPLQLVTSLSLLFGVLALWQVAGPSSWRMVAAGVLLTLASMASFAYGVAVWPWLLLCLAIDRRWYPAAVLALTGALFLYFYSRLIGPGYAVNLPGALKKLPSLSAYVLAQAGSAFGYLIHDTKPLASQLAGAVLIAAHALMSWLMLKPARWADRHRRWLWLIAGWLLTSMLLTALGRHYLGPAQGMASRYLVPSILYAACVLALAWSLAAARPRWQHAIGAMAMLVVAGVVAGIPVYADRFVAIRVNQRAAVLAERIGVTEINDGVPNTQLNLWPLPKVYDYLSQHRMSVFAEEWIEWLGSDSAQFGQAVPRRCQFSHELRTPFRGGDRLIGWVYSPDTRAAPDHVLFVHEGKVVGMGFMLLPRQDLVTAFASTARHAGYYGYLPTLAGEPVRVLGRFADGSICAAGEVPAVAAVTQ